MTRRNHSTLLLLALTFLSACAVGPDYRRPAVATPAAYKEANGWKRAEPRDDVARGNWWQVYGDPELNALVSQVQVSNQNVIAAAAQVRQAQALLGVARAGYFPTLSGDLSASRGSAAGTAAVGNTDRLSLSAAWEADVWGRIARTVEANQAQAQASAADLRAALLSAQATLVQSYLQLRVNDAEHKLLDQTIAAYRRSLAITRNRYAAGVAGRSDVAQAETQLESTQAQAIDLGVARAQLEHAIAVLDGSPPADFRLPPSDAIPALPTIPVGLPSELLERRPDIAAAERRMAAANAQIGVAQAAFFPSLSISAAGGYQNSSLSQLLTLPNRFWSLGPSLAASLFDAGARRAQRAQAIAAYDQSVAGYRQTVLSAFQEVEDNLAALRILADEAKAQQAARRSAAEALQLTDNQYQAGTVSYLNVVTAQAAALAADRASLAIAGSRLAASVSLQKALGGDWRGGAEQ
ncbi:outer membrane protein OprM precursor [mine drainage metagenome]|uniref:Outer membrane protein OprM n=1 Tax=mine drainage metagenome TaxID=410659 RepID=A0A1J5R5A7_9ZZZZ